MRVLLSVIVLVPFVYHFIAASCKATAAFLSAVRRRTARQA